MIAIMILVRRGRRQSQGAQLAAGERMRPLLITVLDPIVSIVIIGSYLWRLVVHSPEHLFAAIVGGGVGIAVGYARSRVMFVRADRSLSSIVLRRSGLEYALVGLLLLLRVTENSLHANSSSLAIEAVSALASLGLFEAVSRSAFIVARYRSAPTSPEPAGE